MTRSDLIDYIAAQFPKKDAKEGEKVIIPAKYVQHFNAGRELRARVDSK